MYGFLNMTFYDFLYNTHLSIVPPHWLYLTAHHAIVCVNSADSSINVHYLNLSSYYSITTIASKCWNGSQFFHPLLCTILSGDSPDLYLYTHTVACTKTLHMLYSMIITQRHT